MTLKPSKVTMVSPRIKALTITLTLDSNLAMTLTLHFPTPTNIIYASPLLVTHLFPAYEWWLPASTTIKISDAQCPSIMAPLYMGRTKILSLFSFLVRIVLYLHFIRGIYCKKINYIISLTLFE